MVSPSVARVPANNFVRVLRIWHCAPGASDSE